MRELGIGLAALMVLASAAPGFAQESGRIGAAETRFAGGVVWQRGIFGDDDPESGSALGVVLGVQTRRRTDGRVAASIELAFQPVGLPNPHFDETLRTLYVLAGPEIGRRIYVRPVGGVALQMWTGSSAEDAFSFALAAGVAVGWRAGSGDRRISPEFVVRCSGSPGAASMMIGMQIAVGSRN